MCSDMSVCETCFGTGETDVLGAGPLTCCFESRQCTLCTFNDRDRARKCARSYILTTKNPLPVYGVYG